MLTFLIVASLVLSYFFVAGRVGASFYRAVDTRCPDCPRGVCYDDHAGAAIFTGILFPLSLPLILGMYGRAGFGVEPKPRVSRDERRRSRELTEARHKEELARIQARTTRELEQALKEF